MSQRTTVEWLQGDEAIITTTVWGLLGRRSVRFRGSCTVWHDAETGRRASTLMEARLSDAWTKALWERDAADTAA